MSFLYIFAASDSPTRFLTVGNNSSQESWTTAGSCWKGYIGYIKVTDKTTNTLIHNIVPVLRNGHPYLYDKVTGMFYYTGGLTVADEIPTT